MQFLNALLCFLFLTSMLSPQAVVPAEPARLLVLFKHSEGFTASSNPFRNNFDRTFSNQGYRLDYIDIESRLPDSGELEKYDALISWYTTSILKDSEKYIEWLAENISHGRKVIILDNFGAFSPDGETWLSKDLLNHFYLLLGLEFEGAWTDKEALLEVVNVDKQFVGQQASIDAIALNNYFNIKSINPQNHSYLTINRKDIDNGQSHVIIRTPFGGMALQGYVTQNIDGQPGFILDVVRFVKSCLDSPTAVNDLPARSILALLKKTEDESVSQSLINRYAFKPLLQLGYKTTFRFVEDGLPDFQAMQSFDAVITWFRTAEMFDGENYVNWLLQQIELGRKIVIVGNFGSFKALQKVDSNQANGGVIDWWISSTKLNNFFYPFGLEFLGGWTGNPEILEIETMVSDIVEKDIELKKSDLTHYYTWKSVHPENKVFLQVNRLDQLNSKSAFVIRTPYGGMAFEGYIMKWDPARQVMNFRLNLAGFLEECLTYPAQTLPKPIALTSHQTILDNEPQRNGDVSPSLQPETPVFWREATEIKRWVLALYDSRENPDLTQNPIPNRAELILNHLGLVLEYWDIKNGLPPADYMTRFRGVLSWFYDPIMNQPDRYARWLENQVQANRKVVILGNYGAFYDLQNELPAKGVRSFFSSLGLRAWDTKIQASKKQKITFKSLEMMDFETEVLLEDMHPFLTKITSESPHNQVYLSIEDTQIGQIDAVVVTPMGGIALDESAFKPGVKDEKWLANLRNVIEGVGDIELAENAPIGFWRLNPFRFFAEAFDLTALPTPDVTTLNGLRIFYSHIDGDGLTGISLIDSKSYSSEFVRDEILNRYPLPFTSSVISRDIEEKGLPYYNRAYTVARSIYALENVEAATHSYSHPYDWRRGDMEARLVKNRWEWEDEEIDYAKELFASVRFIEANLLPPGKKVETYLWSGRCNPDERALGWIEKMGVKNMNGGDPIFDSRFPSYSMLAPLATNVDGYWQFYTSASNDFIYTRGWTKDFGNMAKLVDHFERTGTPVRILPINIYFHFYVGDRREGLDGLKQAFDYCMSQQIAPVFASNYVKIVEDFIGLRLYSLPDGGYGISHNGTLRTLRFDHVSHYPDLEKSQGVIGYLVFQNSLYVHLDDGTEQTIYLQPTRPQEVYLKYGSHYVAEWKADQRVTTFHVRGVGKAEFEIANLLPSTAYQVSITTLSSSEHVKRELLKTDSEGDLMFNAMLVGYHGRYGIRIQAE